MARCEKGRFLDGPDPERHRFTQDEVKRGYRAAVESVRRSLGHAGDFTAKKVLLKRMARTEARRYDLPEPLPPCPRPQGQEQDRKGRSYTPPPPAYTRTQGGEA